MSFVGTTIEPGWNEGIVFLEDQAFADRLITYADALVAVSFVGMSGLSIALADPGIRCSLTYGLVPLALLNLIFGIIISLILVVFRIWESDLRSGAPPSERSAKYAHRLHAARLVIV